MAKTEQPRTHKVRVLVREVPYTTVSTNPLGQTYLEQRTGYGPGSQNIHPQEREDDPRISSVEEAQKDFKYGETIELMDEEYLRLKKAGAVGDADEVEKSALEADDEVLDVATATPEDLSRWILQEDPTVSDVVDASDGNPEFAEKLLKAEAEAAKEEQRDPRKGVVDGLSAVISRG